MNRLGIGIIAVMIFTVTPASADHIFMTIKGQTTGTFKGEAVSLARNNEIPVAAVSHQIISPRDMQSGLPTGQRIHKPFFVTKAIGAASPQIINALASNENLTNVLLRFTKRGQSGEEITYYTIKLTNASIASYALRSSDTPKQGNDVTLPDYEEVSFTYHKIEVESLPNHITAVDDW